MLFLAILTAVAISGLETTVRVGIVKAFETAAKVVFGMIKYVMWAAPSAPSAAWRSRWPASAAER